METIVMTMTCVAFIMCVLVVFSMIYNKYSKNGNVVRNIGIVFILALMIIGGYYIMNPSNSCFKKPSAVVNPGVGSASDLADLFSK